MSKWFKFFVIMAIIALVPSVLVFIATLFLKVAIITVCVGLIILLAVLQILGKITLRKMLWWIASIIAIMILVIWSPWDKDWSKTARPPIQPVRAETQTVEPVEMELEWTLPDGELDRGLNSDVLVVKHLEVSDTSMSFDTSYSYGGSTKTANYYLEKSGDKYRGSWSQSAPRDGGDIELKQIGKLSIWTGTGTDRTGRTSSYTLRPKTRK